MDIKELYQAAIVRDLVLSDFETYATTAYLEIPDLLNRVALLFASRFDEGAVSFEDADVAMNKVWPIMLQLY